MSRAAAAGALVLLLAACRHPSRVGTPAPPQERDAERQGEAPAQKGVPPAGARPRVPASPKALLAEGEIAKLQEALARHGYLAPERRAGALDPPTTAAIRRFQRDEGLAETGFPDRLTLQKLGLDPEEAYGKVRDEAKGKGSEGARGEGK
ncbi:MAG TPA: peptidoglycan-binding domain-containing protein [Anaeromyxobacter sp.]